MVHGVQIHLTDVRKAPLSLIQFYILQEAHKLWPEKDIFAMSEESRHEMFDKVCGTDQVRTEFTKNWTIDSIPDLWTGDIPGFRKKVKPYLLY